MKARLPNTDIAPRVATSTIELAEKARWDSSANEVLNSEIYKDLWYLSVQYKFDIASAIAMLVQLVRKHGSS